MSNETETHPILRYEALAFISEPRPAIEGTFVRPLEYLYTPQVLSESIQDDWELSLSRSYDLDPAFILIRQIS